MSKKQLSVRLYGTQVGILEQNSVGEMTFCYDSTATHPISLSLPIQEQPYGKLHCEAFFGGLLPESDTARKAIAQRYGISANNSFALLKAIGHDCAGAISFHEINEVVSSKEFFKFNGFIISENELYQHIIDLPKKPLFMGFEGLRLSLAGVHDKAAVCLIDNQIAIPSHECPTTHILKPAVPGLEELVENEYFCLKIASRIGLPVPVVEIRQVKEISYLLVERYDRKVNNNLVARIHQEDFCQAQGIVSGNKYQNEGGPSFKSSFELLNQTALPAMNRNKLASAMVFNYLIGNMDAHGKNFSLLHKNQVTVELAPFYDIVCTRVYPSLTAKMAMKIGGQYKADEVFAKHWQQLCVDIHYAYPALKQLIKKQAEAMMSAALLEKKYFNEMRYSTSVIEKIIIRMQDHIDHTLKWLQ